MRTAQNLIALVHPESQNQKSVKYFRYLEKCRNDDTLRVTSLGLFSILWIHDHSTKLATPDAVCKYLEPEYKTFYKRIIDIGFLNKWWNIQNNLKDYDVDI